MGIIAAMIVNSFFIKCVFSETFSNHQSLPCHFYDLITDLDEQNMLIGIDSNMRFTVPSFGVGNLASVEVKDLNECTNLGTFHYDSLFLDQNSEVRLRSDTLHTSGNV